MEDIKSKRDELIIKNTQLTNTDKNLKIKNKELEQKNKELEQFAYVASHDLQEPLRTTLSFVELLQQEYKGKLDDKADKYLSFITQSGRMEVLKGPPIIHG
jgi:light-regulated signal transduction histidine kinase (bacteriophytochrome)